MRYRLNQDPRNDGLDLFVEFGWEPALGFWGELRAEGETFPLAEYDSLQRDYDHQSPLLGLVRWLILTGTLIDDGVDEALLVMQSPDPVQISREGRRALDVIETLKREAD